MLVRIVDGFRSFLDDWVKKISGDGDKDRCRQKSLA